MNEAGKGDAPRKTANQTAYAEGYDRIFSKKPKYTRPDLTKQQFIDWNNITELAVRCVGKWAVYVSNGLEFIDEDELIWKFVLQELDSFFQDNKKSLECKSMLISGGLIFFDTKEDACRFYQIFNDGTMTYASAIYAQLHSPDGQCLDENT
jgi:hypothetical protein